MCDEMPIDIHHIIPIRDGGDNKESNAAPLCPTCHRKWGNNPDHRKMISERRDAHYKKCESGDTAASIAAINVKLDSLPSEETIAHLVELIQQQSTSLAQTTIHLDDTEYSFTREEFIHPLIILELLGWISDRAETILSVDLCTANKSNRFCGDFAVEDVKGRRWVKFKALDNEQESISYAHIATTPGGTELVECYTNGGGSGIFGYVAAFRVTKEEALESDHRGRLSRRNRIVLTIIGNFLLGDRYGGSIQYDGQFLKIGPDRGWFNRGKEAEQSHRIP